MRLLVCGGRDFADAARMRILLDRLHAANRFTLLIHGGARGADRLSGEWALSVGLPVEIYYAHWDRLGKAAGHERNARMLSQGRPELVVAFPGGKGTADMVSRSRNAGVLTLAFNAKTLELLCAV